LRGGDRWQFTPSAWGTFGALLGIPGRTIQYSSRITGDTAQLACKLLSTLIDC